MRPRDNSAADITNAFRQILNNVLRDVFRLGGHADEVADVLEGHAKTIRSHIAVRQARQDNPELINLLRRYPRLTTAHRC